MFRIITVVFALVLLLPSAIAQVSVRSLDGNATNLTIRTGRMIGGFNLIGGTNLARTSVTGLEPALDFLTNNIGTGGATNAIGRLQDGGTNTYFYRDGIPRVPVADFQNSILYYNEGTVPSLQFGEGYGNDNANILSLDWTLRNWYNTNGIVNANWNGDFPTFPAGLQAQSIEGSGASAGVLMLKSADGSVTNVYADEDGVIAPRYIGNVGQATNSAGVAIDDLAGGAGGPSNIYYTSLSGAIGGADLSSGSSDFGSLSDHAFLQAVYDQYTNGPIKVVWTDGYSVSDTILYGSGTESEGLPGCGVILQDDVDAPLFMNRNPSRTNATVGNVVFRNLTLNGNGDNQLDLPATVAASNTANVIIAGFGVTNFTMEGCTLLEPASFGLHLGLATNIALLNNLMHVSTDRISTDGYHFNGPIRWLFMRNCTGNGYDDQLALNANDGNSGVLGNQLGPYVGIGPIVDVDAEITLNNSLYGVRLFSTDQLIDRVRLKVSGSSKQHWFIGDQFDGVGGNFGHVIIEGDVQPGTAVTEVYGAMQVGGGWKQLEVTTTRNAWKDNRPLVYFQPNANVQQFGITATGYDTNALAWNDWLTNSGTIQTLRASVNWRQTWSGTNYFLNNNGTVNKMLVDSYLGPERIVRGNQPVLPIERYGASSGSTVTNFIVFEDSFTDTDGTAVIDHTPEQGTWSAAESTAGFQIDGNAAHGSGGLNYIIADAGVSDGTISVFVDPDVTSDRFVFFPRFVNLSNTVTVDINFLNNVGGTELWDIAYGVNSSYTSMAVLTPGASGATFTLSITLNGSSIAVYRNGILLTNVATSVHQTATKFGFVTTDDLVSIDDVVYTAASLSALAPGFMMTGAGGISTTFNGSQLTNVTDAAAMPKAGGVFTGGVGFQGLTNTGPTTVSNLNFGTDLKLEHDAAGVLAQRNGTSPQMFRSYNTYTDASNYERFSVGWVANVAYLSTFSAGTGVPRNMYVGTSAASSLSLITDDTQRWKISTDGHFLAATDNAYDIGASGATRPRNVYVGSGVISGSGVASYRSNLLAAATITVGASPSSWTNTLSPVCSVNVYVDSSLGATTVALNGTTLFGSFAGTQTVGLQPGEYITLTYLAVAPSAYFKPFP